MAKAYVIIFSFLIWLLPTGASAATLFFAPPSGTYGVGSTVTLSVVTNSADQAMNAASGVVSFPWDKLEVVSLSRQGSIFSFWPVEPSFSNTQGTVSFEGIVVNPGYTGSYGKIITITFRVKAPGVANISFRAASALANDGTGANILTGTQVASLNLTAAAQPTTPTAAVVPATTNTLSISSPSHPDQSAWYASPTPSFTWKLPAGTLEVRTAVGKSASLMPSVSYTPPITERTVDALQNGTYYFAVQARTASGWGSVSRYRVNIDTTPPDEFSITFPHGSKGLDPQPVVLFNTTDGQSGISHYDIQVGESSQPLRNAPKADSNPYVLPARLPGTYQLAVTAFDRAGNKRTVSSEYTIESIAPPTITTYQSELETGDILKIRGTTYPDADITILVREGAELIAEEYTRSNALGDFAIVVSKELNRGTFTFTAAVTDGRGARSLESEPYTVVVRGEFLADLIDGALRYLSAIILIVLILVALFILGARLWVKVPSIIARMRRQVKEAEGVTKDEFSTLRKAIVRHMNRLKKADRDLTKEEAAFLKDFERKLADTEAVVEKEIKNIGKR